MSNEIADDDEICVLSGEEFAESLVLLELQMTSSPQEQSKRFTELKNSFSALLEAYKDVNKKLHDAKEEISVLKKRSSMSRSIAPQSIPIESNGAVKTIEEYKTRMLGILEKLDNVERESVPIRGNVLFVDASTQYEEPIINSPNLSLAQSAQSNRLAAASADSSLVITDASDSEIESESQDLSPEAPTDTIRPTGSNIAQSNLSALFVAGAAGENTGNFQYKCPNCHTNFSADTPEDQAIAHLMNCTSGQGLEVRDCPICQKTFKIDAKFSQNDFEVHVQCCCEAGDIDAVNL